MSFNKETIVLVNFNSYLGGGETLLVRFSSFLQERKEDFISFSLKGSYIERDLENRNIDRSKIKSFNINPDFYYLNNLERENVISILMDQLDKDITYKFVVFCMRDLYTVYSLSRYLNCSITHLVLHPEDDLYAGQTLVDKAIYKFFKKRIFNEIRIIRFNHSLVRILNGKNGVISMTEVISNLWKSRVGIDVFGAYIVPLPSFKPLDEIKEGKMFEKKIIWVGRIIDFKIPAINQIISFASNNDFELTIVGDGERQEIEDFIVKNKINRQKIKFIGQVDYNDLPSIINEHAIGYAMGTSLIELAKFRIPVIVALASFDHKNFKSQICGGLFFDKYKGCDGTDLLFIKEEDIKSTISNAIDIIKMDYDKIAHACYEFAKENFSEEENFNKYLEIIQRTGLLKKEDKKLKIPKAAWLRKLAYKYTKHD